MNYWGTELFKNAELLLSQLAYSNIKRPVSFRGYTYSAENKSTIAITREYDKAVSKVVIDYNAKTCFVTGFDVAAKLEDICDWLCV